LPKKAKNLTTDNTDKTDSREFNNFEFFKSVLSVFIRGEVLFLGKAVLFHGNASCLYSKGMDSNRAGHEEILSSGRRRFFAC